MTMDEKDERDIRTLYETRYLAGLWSLFRRGSQGRSMRLVMVGLSSERPASRFRRIDDEMRQGSLYLVDPQGEIVQRVTLPMCRTRW